MEYSSTVLKSGVGRERARSSVIILILVSLMIDIESHSVVILRFEVDLSASRAIQKLHMSVRSFLRFRSDCTLILVHAK